MYTVLQETADIVVVYTKVIQGYIDVISMIAFMYGVEYYADLPRT